MNIGVWPNGKAPGLGPGDWEFESLHPDQIAGSNPTSLTKYNRRIMKHFSLDIETLSTNANAVILSIGLYEMTEIQEELNPEQLLSLIHI